MVNNHTRRRITYRRTALALALGMGFSGLAFGQSTTGSIFGQAPAGDTVVATSATGVQRSVTVDADGRYTINGLPVGSYSVSLQKDGHEVSSRSNVTIQVSAGTDVSFSAAKNLESVTVTANALPAIDVTSVDSRTVITAQQLKTLPLARSAEAIALLAPGATQGSSWFTGPTGNALVSFGGASVTENAYYINGMNVTDPLNGLGGIDLPYGSIEQQETLTGGYGAAYGRSDGGVINQVGKRGTNEWHFGGQALWAPTSLRSDPKNIYNPANGKIYQYRNDNKGWNTTYDAYIGGPLIKDKLFLFTSVEASKSKDTLVSTASSNTAYKRDFHDPKWYTKLDWNINDSNIVELTAASTKHQYNGDVYAYDTSTRTLGDFEGTDTSTKTSAQMWIAKYTGYITDNLTVTAQYGKQKTEIFTSAGASIDPSIIPIAGADSENPAYTGGTPITNSQLSGTIGDPAHQTKGANYRIDLTYVLGDHTITAGIDNQRTQDLHDGEYIPAGYNWEYGKVDPGSFISETPSGEMQVDTPSNYPGGAQGYYVDQYKYQTAASVRVEQRAQYIEDSWQVSDRWLLKLGLRNDQFTNFNSNGQPYIRQTKPQWAPRLGFSWDVNGDSSFRVYGNAGRYYLALPTSVALRGASGSLFTRTYYTYTGIDANGYPTGLTPVNTVNGPGQPYSENLEYGQSPDPKTVTAKSLTAQYQDEYILGFDKQLNSAWTYGAKAVYRSLKNEIDDTCQVELFTAKALEAGLDPSNLRGCYFFNPGRAATFTIPDGKGGYGEIHLSNEELGFQHAKRNYYALNLYLNHPFDGTWWGRLDYTFSRSYGNSEGQVKSDTGQSDISATQDWDYPSLMEYQNGLLHNDHKHQLKVSGGYQITPEWNVSGVISMISGAPYDCLGAYGPNGTYPAYAGPYYHWCSGKPVPSGSAGRLPWQKTVSLNVEYRPAFADNKLAFNADVFNLFNSQKPTYIYEYQNAGQFGRVRGYTTPRYVRLGVTYDF
ncbi:TonB-dependent receptor [Rhodanobacter sp. 7MK24]|uniref:TonB-dependent receptor n=1 Tax=Rhodanobacter sp. 7MK24 TaxID=2775922 RepID=UPI001CE0DBD3|nr:TonB-dependent receptor [Rhodanobacter sp. 7MK24]